MQFRIKYLPRAAALFAAFFLNQTIFADLPSCNPDAKMPHGFYLGPSVGYGSTNWSFLTTEPNSPAAAASPISADDSGLVYGVIMGYQLSNYFAIEGDYMHYPLSHITFEAYSDYWPDSDSNVTISSNSQQIGLYLKLFVPFQFLGNTRVFSGIGIEDTMRFDSLAAQNNRIGGIFTGGLIHFFTNKIAAETAFDYSTGAGKASAYPAYYYTPFLYQAHFVLMYYFS